MPSADQYRSTRNAALSLNSRYQPSAPHLLNAPSLSLAWTLLSSRMPGTEMLSPALQKYPSCVLARNVEAAVSLRESEEPAQARKSCPDF
ncbi:hypothetical protein MRB53_039302 [Persea americana]|nr:hypothetical protein MRB53_039302 [Persea americana]